MGRAGRPQANPHERSTTRSLATALLSPGLLERFAARREWLVGEFDRHSIFVGEIHVVWSNLISNEAMTFVMLRNHAVVAGPIVLNPNVSFRV